MNRRTALKLGTTLGALAGAGAFGAYRLLPPGRSRVLLPVDELARRFHDSLDPELRARVCVEYDHPLRQYHNRGVAGGGASIFRADFTRHQRSLLTDLLYAGLSEAGRERVPREFFLQLPGVHLLNVLLCGDPSAPPYQLVLSGPHLNLRLGGRSREGVAFGGPQVYGDQHGDSRPGLPGNVYRYQFLAAARLFRSLSPAEQHEARLEAAPIQTRIELQGRAGRFPGLALADAAPESLELARELVDGILGTYAAEDVAQARECLAANGGVAALSFSTYAEGELDGGASQIFRLEGPAAVFHFRGAPHVHAFLNVAMDGDAPLSVGEPLGENPEVLESPGVKRLFELALRRESAADLGYYPLESALGRLRTGPIRSGDIYTLESWQDRAVVVSVRGARLAPPMVAALQAAREPLDPERIYGIATSGEVAGGSASEVLGKVESRREGALLREVTIAYLRRAGFAEVHAEGG